MSIIDTLRTISLFRGVTAETMSRTVGAIPLQFASYSAGDDVAVPGQSDACILLLLSGSVDVVRQESDITVNVRFEAPCAVMPETLFGAHQSGNCSIRATAETSTATIDKLHYMEMLEKDRIFMLNYMLHMTAAARRPGSWLPVMDNPALVLNRWLESLWMPGASRVTVFDPAGRLPAMLGMTAPQLRSIIAEAHLGTAEAMTFTNPKNLLTSNHTI